VKTVSGKVVRRSLA